MFAKKNSNGSSDSKKKVSIFERLKQLGRKIVQNVMPKKTPNNQAYSVDSIYISAAPAPEKDLVDAKVLQKYNANNKLPPKGFVPDEKVRQERMERRRKRRQEKTGKKASSSSHSCKRTSRKKSEEVVTDGTSPDIETRAATNPLFEKEQGDPEEVQVSRKSARAKASKGINKAAVNPLFNPYDDEKETEVEQGKSETPVMRLNVPSGAKTSSRVSSRGGRVRPMMEKAAANPLFVDV